MPPEDHLPTTFRAAERRVTRLFREAGLATPDLDARLLIEAAAGIDRLVWVRAPDAPLPGEAARVLDRLVARRLAREPVSRILGFREFYGRAFEITPATLDPRADSETLIDAALAIADTEGWRDRQIDVLDIGTGSGCLLVTLLAELPRSTGVGTDIDDEALAVAAHNAARQGVGDRARWQRARSLTGVAGGFQLIVANPPYVRSAEIGGLAPEACRHDPLSALDGGPDGLAIHREIVAGLNAMRHTGWILLEVGCDQAADVRALLQHWKRLERASLRTIADLSGRDRCVAARAQS